jgi:hypothetical protein
MTSRCVPVPVSSHPGRGRKSTDAGRPSAVAGMAAAGGGKGGFRHLNGKLQQECLRERTPPCKKQDAGEKHYRWAITARVNAGMVWWSGAADEPALVRPGGMATTYEGQPSRSYRSTNARPPKAIKVPTVRESGSVAHDMPRWVVAKDFLCRTSSSTGRPRRHREPGWT